VTEVLTDILRRKYVAVLHCKFREKTSDASTVYKFDTIDVDGKTEVQFKI
jgi:hypothetical protein